MTTTVLLIENDDMMISYMKDFLEINGYDCLIAGSHRDEVIMALGLNPDITKLVKFQFQVSTIAQGFDAAEYFTKYRGRFISMHAQGWSMDAKQQVATGSAQDSLDWKKIFTAAKTGGIKNYFVEMTPFDLMKASVPYLRSLQV